MTPLLCFFLALVCSLLLHSFFFLAPAPPALFFLSLHDALPISASSFVAGFCFGSSDTGGTTSCGSYLFHDRKKHTSELQSHLNLVCRLLLEKKKKTSR